MLGQGPQTASYRTADAKKVIQYLPSEFSQAASDAGGSEQH